MERLLLVFVKNPVPGRVKTRLARTIGDGKALWVYERLLEHTRRAAGASRRTGGYVIPILCLLLTLGLKGDSRPASKRAKP
jgi:glycosyltransferase A (GT-A) superfamily protein (DUF2064 family)